MPWEAWHPRWHPFNETLSLMNSLIGSTNIWSGSTISTFANSVLRCWTKNQIATYIQRVQRRHCCYLVEISAPRALLKYKTARLSPRQPVPGQSRKIVSRRSEFSISLFSVAIVRIFPYIRFVLVPHRYASRKELFCAELVSRLHHEFT